jgi:1,4-alpha-glucan branching enzyme
MKYASKNPETNSYDGIFWNPPTPYKFKYDRSIKLKEPKIYEAYIGCAGSEPKTHTY